MKRLLLVCFLLAAAGACDDSPSEPDPAPSPDLEVGDTLAINVQTGPNQACTEPDNRTGRVAAITDRAIVVEDTGNPSGGFTDAEYESLGKTFDTLVWRVDVENFGEPQDIDGNDRVIIFYTRAVNELTPEGQDFYVGGFFFSRDLFPRQGNAQFQGCTTSNEAEMFYMLVPDPSGEVNGNVREKSFVADVTITTLAHEFQHLINASRRLYVVRAGGSSWNEEVWLNEGLSHIAEELVGHDAGGTSPGENIDEDRIRQSQHTVDVFNTYHSSNFGRLISYLENPDTASALGGVDTDDTAVDNLATRGATWQFLRYAADRKDGPESALWQSMVTSELQGLENLAAALEAEPLTWMRDWAVSVYADDFIAGIEDKYTQATWNYRSIMAALENSDGNFPLRVRELENGTTSLTIRGGGMAFLEFGVGPADRAQIKVDPAAADCRSSGPAENLEVGEVHLASGDDAGAICVNGGALGAAFVYVPFFASEVGSATLALEITASGTREPIGISSASRSPARASLLRAPVEAERLRPDRAWERQLRIREIRELSPLVPGGHARIAALEARLAESKAAMNVAAADERLRVAIVRVD